MACNFFIFGVLCNYGYASTLNGKFEGNQLTLMNATTEGDNYVPSFWLPAANVLTSAEWVPGYYSSAPTQLILTNSVGDSVNVDIRFTGIEYNIATPPTSMRPISSGTPSCTDSAMRGASIYRLKNSSPAFCTATNSLELPGNNTPFRFLRPIFKIDKTKLADQFKGKTSGKYRGTMFGVTASYGFKMSQQSPIWTYRNLPANFDMVIDYQGNKLTNVSVLGNGLIPPIYDTIKSTVSGETQFDIKAEGYFSDGLSIDLVTKPNYQLLHTASGESIPYNLTCQQCLNQELVRNGSLVTSSTSVLKPNSTEINFSVKASYQDIPRGTLVTGTYNDSFVLVMGPKV